MVRVATDRRAARDQGGQTPASDGRSRNSRPSRDLVIRHASAYHRLHAFKLQVRSHREHMFASTSDAVAYNPDATMGE